MAKVANFSDQGMCRIWIYAEGPQDARRSVEGIKTRGDAEPTATGHDSTISRANGIDDPSSEMHLIAAEAHSFDKAKTNHASFESNAASASARVAGTAQPGSKRRFSSTSSRNLHSNKDADDDARKTAVKSEQTLAKARDRTESPGKSSSSEAFEDVEM